MRRTMAAPGAAPVAANLNFKYVTALAEAARTGVGGPAKLSDIFVIVATDPW